jgi:hypothetical protein
MATNKLAFPLFLLAAFLFLIVALLPAARGDGVDYTYLVLAIVFFVIAMTTVRRRGKGTD